MLGLLRRRIGPASVRLALARALRQHASSAAGGAVETSTRRTRPSNTPVWLALAAVGVLGAGVAGRDSLREAPEAARAVLALSRALVAELTEAGEAGPDGRGTGRGWPGVSAAAATLLCDVAASPRRRHVLVTAGNGHVLDWLLHAAGGATAASSEARNALVALLSDERTGPEVLARQGAAQHLLHCAAAGEPRHGTAALAGAVHNTLAALSPAQRSAMCPTCSDVDAALDTVADASAPAGATGVAAALLACWCGSQAHVISQRPRAALALSSALASFSKARAWHQAAQVADTLAAVAAHEPYRLASHSPGAQALRDAALAALGPTIPGDAAADAVATGVACTQALTLALDGRSSGEEPLYGAALSAVLPALAASPALQTTGAVGTAAARAVAALHEAGGLDGEARNVWLPHLLAWAAPRTSAMPVASPSLGDEYQTRMRQQACVAALTRLVSGQDLAAAWVAHAWLAFMLRALAADTAGWAPRIVADDAAAAANTAAAALDTAVAAAAARSGQLALSSAAPPRRLYGLLPPAAPALPPRPAAPAEAAAAAPKTDDNAAGGSPPPLASGLKALALVLTTEPGLCTAALASGALPLLARLTARAELGDRVEADNTAPAPPHAAVQRQLARVVAHLALLPAAAPVVAGEPFASWLGGVVDDYEAEAGASQGLPSATRKLASHARRALLNADAVMRSLQDAGDGGGGASPLPRFGDGLFFFQPGSEAATGQGCVLDVVFIHGLRGGPFGTWRTSPAAAQGGPSSPREPQQQGGPQHATPGGGKPRRRQRQGRAVTVWPADWLPADVAPAGGLRLLSLSFRSRYSDWEGTTQGLDALADALLEKLTSAGVGARPCVLVGHSMGGVLIKLMLLRASQEPRHAHLATSLRGAVFYSCPHFGSALAAYGSWRVLRLAPGVTALKPGTPSLESLNDHLRRLHKRAQAPVRVLSFLEGAPTTLAELPVPGLKGRAIAAEIVAAESAYPGFGDLVVLPQCDHIDACKPRDKEEPNYKRTLELIRAAAQEAAAQLSTQEETPTNS